MPQKLFYRGRMQFWTRFMRASVLLHARDRVFACARPCLCMRAIVSLHVRVRVFACARPCLCMRASVSLHARVRVFACARSCLCMCASVSLSVLCAIADILVLIDVLWDKEERRGKDKKKLKRPKLYFMRAE